MILPDLSGGPIAPDPSGSSRYDDAFHALPALLSIDDVSMASFAAAFDDLQAVSGILLVLFGP
jgi:hypothetical protein